MPKDMHTAFISYIEFLCDYSHKSFAQVNQPNF